MKSTRTLARAGKRFLHYTTSQFVLLLAGLGLLYVCVLFVLNSSLSSLIIEQAFNRSFKGSIEWDRVQFGPLPWELDVVGLKIKEPDGTPVITADGLQIERVDLASIIAGDVYVDGLLIINPIVDIHTIPRESKSVAAGMSPTFTNIEQVFEPLVPTSPDPNARIDVTVRGIQIQNASVKYASSQFKLQTDDAALNDVDFRLSIAPSANEMSIDARLLNSEKNYIEVARTDGDAQRFKWVITKLALRGLHMSGDRIRVESLTSLLEGDALQLSNLMLDLGANPGPSMVIDAQLDSNDIAVHLTQFGVMKTKGGAKIKLNGNGAISNFTGSLSVNSPSLTAESYELNDVALEAKLTKGRHLEVLPSAVGIWDGSLKLLGKLDLISGNGDAAVTVDSMTAHRLPGLGQPVRFGLNEGKLGAALNIKISKVLTADRRLSLDGTLNFARSNPRISVAKRLDFTIKGAYENTKITLEKFQAKSKDERVTVAGWFDHVDKRVNVTGSVFVRELQPWTALWNIPLSGQANADFVVAGVIDNPNVQLSLKNTVLNHQAVVGVGVAAEASLSNRKLLIKNLRLMTESSGVAIFGTLDLKPKSPTMALSLLTENLELSVLKLPRALSGRASLEIDVEGSLETPTVDVRGRLRELCVDLNETGKRLCIDAIQTESNLSRDQFSLKSFTVRDSEWGMISATGNGSVRKRSFSGTVDVVDFPLPMLDGVLANPIGLAGTLDADLSLSGTLDHPIGGGKIEIQGLRRGRYDLGDVTILALANELKSTIQVLLLDGQRLILNVPFDDSLPPTAELRLKAFVPKKWLPQLAEIPLTAKFSGSANAQFKDRTFALDSAQVSLSDIECIYDLSGLRVHLEPSGDVAASWQDGNVSIDRLHLAVLTQNNLEGDTADKIETMSIKLRGGLPELKRFDLQYDGTVSMSGIRPFIRGTFSRSEGDITFSGLLQGPLEAPAPTTEIQIASASLTPRSAVVGTLIELQEPMKLSVKPTEGSTTPGNWTIQRRPGKSGESTPILRDESVFKLKELSIEFERFVPRRIVVAGSVMDLALRVPGILRGTINAPTLEVEWSTPSSKKLSGSPELRIAGDIEVQNGVYVKDITGVNEINEGVRNTLFGRSATQTVNAAERFPILKRLKLDLSVLGDGDFYIQNRITVFSLDMEIRIALEKITGYLYPAPGDTPEEQLKILGEVTILPDSKLIYARREFEVNRGVIDFGRGQFMDASLEASRTFTLRSNRSSGVTNTQFDRGGGDVRLEEVNLTTRIQQSSLEGEPRISMNLSSNSGASKFDVAMLVLTGSYPEDASSAASAQPATQVLLAPLLNLVERPLEDTLDIDLSLTPANAGSLFIDIDKMLSRRLRLYSRVFVGDGDDTNPQQFGLEYQINNTVIGEFTSEQTTNYLSTAGRFRLKLELD